MKKKNQKEFFSEKRNNRACFQNFIFPLLPSPLFFSSDVVVVDDLFAFKNKVITIAISQFPLDN